MDNWRIVEKGGKLRVYKNSEHYCWIPISDSNARVYRKLAEEHADNFEGFQLFIVMDKFFSTGEREFQL